MLSPFCFVLWSARIIHLRWLSFTPLPKDVRKFILTDVAHMHEQYPGLSCIQVAQRVATQWIDHYDVW